MTTPQPELHSAISVLRQANHIARQTNLNMLLEQMLDLIMGVLQARVGIVYLYDDQDDRFLLRAARGNRSRQRTARELLANDLARVRAVVSVGTPAFYPDVSTAELERACHQGQSSDGQYGQIMCYVPMLIDQQPVGVIHLLGLSPAVARTPARLELAQLVLDRLVTEVQKTYAMVRQRNMLLSSERRERTLQSLIEFISCISTTLEREELIRLIMDYAETLLDVETTSFWLQDEHDGRLKLLVASGETSNLMNEVSVALGEGIIGHVVQTGERKVVNDVRTEPLFSRKVDQESGFVTQSVLTVPMKAPKIQRGDVRGAIEESIIGGAQALNKRGGHPFTDEDVRYFEILARQAATAFQFSRLFEEDYTLFWGIIKATTSAIDFTDPYARGHSARVSEFSVIIGEQLGLPVEDIYRVRVGSMLHDVGKIGISEQILRKPGRLTNEEFDEIKQHPMYGVQLFEEAGLGNLLSEELLALAQHHERLDGRGYPYGLRGERISRIGRIVAVADVFDALTSDRTYRAAFSGDEAIALLQDMAGTELDAACVAALAQARKEGKILVQNEREEQPHQAT